MTETVITGMACICAAGDSPASVLAAMHRGERHLSCPEILACRACPDPLPHPFFAVPDHFLGGRKHSARDTFCLARHCLHKAVLQAGLTDREMPRTAIVLGTTSGSALHFLDAYDLARRRCHDGKSAEWNSTGHKTSEHPSQYCQDRIRSDASQSDLDDYLASNLAMDMDLPLANRPAGPLLTISNACTTGADAIGLAMDLLHSGQADHVLCGGADALSIVPHTGFARLMIHDDQPCRPFDAGRHGLNLGEGAAVMVLETMAAAQRRKATVLGRVAGFGMAADGYHFTAPHPEGQGLEKAICQALAQSGLDPSDLAFVNAHATATRENDKVEGRLLARFLPGLPVWASKGCTGHTLGAAGAIEAVLAMEALRQGLVPPSTGFAVADPEIGLCPTTRSTEVRQAFALSTSLGFGGGNSALVLGLDTSDKFDTGKTAGKIIFAHDDHDLSACALGFTNVPPPDPAKQSSGLAVHGTGLVLAAEGQNPPELSQDDLARLKELLPSLPLRRIPRLVRMELLAAILALCEAGWNRQEILADTALVIGSAHGCPQTSLDFMDSILDNGPQLSSPTAFSHAVNNVHTGLLSLHLGIRGQCLNVTQFEQSFSGAVEAARALLASGRAKRVLLGMADETDPRLELCLACSSHDISSQNSCCEATKKKQASKQTDAAERASTQSGAVFFCLGLQARDLPCLVPVQYLPTALACAMASQQATA